MCDDSKIREPDGSKILDQDVIQIYDGRNQCYVREIQKQKIENFCNSFYRKLDSISSKKQSSNASLYHDEVIKLLMFYKGFHDKESISWDGVLMSKDSLSFLQSEIENITMKFDSKSVFKIVPILIKLLINKYMITSKEYLM